VMSLRRLADSDAELDVTWRLADSECGRDADSESAPSLSLEGLSATGGRVRIAA
jgi:hypothetical protein